jgi:4-amino-4-deoxy-L-arabinose transferase-like glycosyltransferase
LVTLVKLLRNLPENWQELGKSALIFSLSLVVIWIFFLLLPESLRTNESSDFYHWYYPAAKNLLAGRGLVNDSGELITAYPPLHSIFLAFAIQVANTIRVPEIYGIYAYTWLAFGLSSVVVYLLASRLWKGWLSLLPSILWITYFPALWSAKQPNSEAPFTLFLLISIYLVWKSVSSDAPHWVQLAIAGLSVSLPMLYRSIALFLGLVLGVFIFVILRNKVAVKKRAFLAVIFLVAAYLPVVGWGFYAKAHTGQFVWLSTSGIRSVKDGLTFGVNDDGSRQDISLPGPAGRAMGDFAGEFQRGEINTLPKLAAVFVGVFARNPVGVSELVAIKMARAWFALDSMRFEKYVVVYQCAYLGLIAAAFALSWKNRYVPHGFSGMVLLVLMLFWMMTTLVLSILRYMTPIFPLLFLYVPALVKGLRPLRLCVKIFLPAKDRLLERR